LLARRGRLLAETAEQNLAAAADHQLVVTAAVIVALREATPQLRDAGAGIELDRPDRLHQVREPLGKCLGNSLEAGAGRAGQFRRSDAQRVEGDGKQIPP
jgi:hypothetical protein